MSFQQRREIYIPYVFHFLVGFGSIILCLVTISSNNWTSLDLNALLGWVWLGCMFSLINEFISL